MHQNPETQSKRILDVARLLQFGDSALPVGTFSFSNGLEAAVQTGVVHDLSTLEQFVRTCVEQSATSDGIAVLHAFRATKAFDDVRLVHVDWTCFNRKTSEDLRRMSTRMGCKMAELADRVVGGAVVRQWLRTIRCKETPGTYPVAQGAVFAEFGATEQDAFAAHQYGVCSMMLGAALRLMKLHYLDVQAIMFRINESVSADYHRVADASLDQMAALAPVFDILTAHDVRSRIRMFLS